MIGSNMVQTAIMMGLTPNICAYDPYAPALEGVAEEMFHCGFEGVNLTYTSDIAEALGGARYVVSSGGAARKAGMTREDLLKGNAAIAAQFGKDLRTYCPDVKHVVVIFNPADITGLITLLYSGLEPSQVTTLAGLDSTRLRSELAKHFRISPDRVEDCRTYGGHGEQMAVFASTATVGGKPLAKLIGTPELTDGQWDDIRQRVIQGGKRIIELRGRSSFQSPAYLSIEMIRAVPLAGRSLCRRRPLPAYRHGHGDRDRPYGRSLQGAGRHAGGDRVARGELPPFGQAARRGDRHGSDSSDCRMGRAQPEYAIGTVSPP